MKIPVYLWADLSMIKALPNGHKYGLTWDGEVVFETALRVKAKSPDMLKGYRSLE